MRKNEQYCLVEKNCPLYHRSEVPFQKGKNKELLLVGQSPAVNEVQTKAPFTGPSGRLLNNVLKAVGLERNDFYVANALRCTEAKPPLSGKAQTRAIEACRCNLEDLIKNNQPKLIVAMGAYALRSLLGKGKITNKRGQLFWSDEFNCHIYVTMHPAAVIREATPSYPNKDFETMNNREKEFFLDIQNLKKIIDSGMVERKIDVSGYKETRYEVLEEINANAEVVAVDFETTGLDYRNPDTRVISVSFTVEEGKSHVVLFDTALSRTIEAALSILRNDRITKVVAARPFDEMVSKHLLNAQMGGEIHDVLSMAHLIDENYYSFNLEGIANLYAGMRNIKDLADGKRHNLQEATYATIIQYNGVDTDATFRSYTKLKGLIESKGLNTYYTNFVMPIQDMLCKASENGCLINQEVLAANTDNATKQMEALENRILDAIPPVVKERHAEKGLSLTRLAFLRDALFSHDGLNMTPVRGYVTPGGDIQCNEEHLKNFIHYQVVQDYLDWKKLQKVTTSYLNNISDYIKRDNKIYPTTSITRTVTGRSVMLNPAIQTYPSRGSAAKLIREAMVADPDHILAAVDLSQSELRIMGWMANDKNILDALSKGIDLHTKTAAIVNNVPVENVTKEMRNKAKGVNFGLIYGMQADSLVNYLKKEYGLVYTLEECIRIRLAFFSRPDGYYNLQRHYAKVIQGARSKGYSISPIGRRRHLPGINSTDFEKKTESERQAINAPVQSFSSDLGLIGMKMIMDKVPYVKPMWFIHDAVIIQVPKKRMLEGVDDIKRCMEVESVKYIWDNFGVHIGYPVECEIKLGFNWGHMKPAHKFIDELVVEDSCGLII